MLDQPTTQPLSILVLVILLTWYFHRAYVITGMMSPHEDYQVYVHYYGQQNLNLTAA